MFLFHITPDNLFALKFIKTYNKFETFEFITYVLCSYSEDLIAKINEFAFNNNNVNFLLYKNDEQMMKFIGSIDIKYVFYQKNFINIWNNINFFNKYVLFYNNDDTTITTNKIIIQNDTLEEKFDKENYTFQINTDMSEKKLHTFFRNIFSNVNSNCIVDDQKNTLIYIGTNPSHAILIDVKMIAGLPVTTSTDKPPTNLVSLQDKQENIKVVNGVYKSNSSKFEKNIETDSIKVAVVGDWIASKELQKLWKRYCKTENKWNNLELVDDTASEIDFYIIINRANFTCNNKVPTDKCIVFHMEPNMEFIPWYREFVKYFNSQDLLFNGLHMYHKNNVDWHISLSHSELTNIKSIKKTKDNSISMVMSNRRDNIGHVMRLDLAHKLDTNNSLKVDIYGKCKEEKFINYKSELPYYCRDDAILPYKYHFMAENTSIDNYFTEKIIDCILGETLCFYWGCNTLEKFIDPRCFIRLPLHDIDKSLEIIQNSIANNEWEKRVDIIRSERNKMLNVYSFMPRVKNILRLNVGTNIFILGDKPVNNIEPFIKTLVDQSFKNVFYKPMKVKGFDATTFIEICVTTVSSKKSTLILNYENCILPKSEKIYNLLHDKICDTVGLGIDNFKDELLFFFNDKHDPNDILNMDCYITVDMAQKIINSLETNKYNTILQLFENIPLVRMRYIF